MAYTWTQWVCYSYWKLTMAFVSAPPAWPPLARAVGRAIFWRCCVERHPSSAPRWCSRVVWSRPRWHREEWAKTAPSRPAIQLAHIHYWLPMPTTKSSCWSRSPREPAPPKQPSWPHSLNLILTVYGLRAWRHFHTKKKLRLWW